MTTARFSIEMPRMFAFYSLIALAVIGAACGGGRRTEARAAGRPAARCRRCRSRSSRSRPSRSSRSTEFVGVAEVAPLDHHPARSRRVHDPDRRAIGTERRRRAPCCSRSTRRPSRPRSRRCSRCGRRASPTSSSRGSRSQRNKTLLDAGAVSQREVEQVEAQLRAAEAQLKALDEQIRQQRSELGYYRVTAPIAGVVGDIPVRVGDRVTRSTVLTTVDENDGLEVYINVPVQQAPQLKLGTAGAAHRRSRPGARDEQDHVRLAVRRRPRRSRCWSRRS